jgi:hypothetical protein
MRHMGMRAGAPEPGMRHMADAADVADAPAAAPDMRRKMRDAAAAEMRSTTDMRGKMRTPAAVWRTSATATSRRRRCGTRREA